MKPILKRFGAAGLVLLVLNEIRGLIVVGLAIGALFGPGSNEAAIRPAAQPTCAVNADCIDMAPAP